MIATAARPVVLTFGTACQVITATVAQHQALGESLGVRLGPASTEPPSAEGNLEPASELAVVVPAIGARH